MTLRPYTTVLRRAGFQFGYRSRAGDCHVTEFWKREGDRELKVQLWADGKHRVSHGIHGKHGLRQSDTPTDFETVADMECAIKREWTRPTTADKP